MILINSVTISRYRSIMDLTFQIDNFQNLISICGENNVGKTNTLRAINLFFNPEDYDPILDIPTLKNAQRSASSTPKIKIVFLDKNKNEYFSITRDFKNYEFNKTLGLNGYSYKIDDNFMVLRNSKKTLNDTEMCEILKKINFSYIESININIPKLIKQLTDDIITVEYDKARIVSAKKTLRDAYLKYTTGLQELLDTFSDEISSTFKNFKNNWNIKFHVPSNIETFRDVISDDVELKIDDKGCLDIEQKGSGLQRLAVILLNFEILKRFKDKKNFIICIDEPDIYLHEGLQRKLLDFFSENSSEMQIFYTTHSKIFIDQYSMKNIILLSAKNYKKFSKRKNKYIDVVETIYIDISDDRGYETICQHLGIEKNKYNLLEEQNILVEGNSDKIYIEELANYFKFKFPNIISANGVDKIEKFLDFYNSYYRNANSTHIPKIKVIFDNDPAGREVYKKISKKEFKFIKCIPLLLKNYSNDENQTKDNVNNEIEDLIYPDILCYLVNILLKEISLNTIKFQNIEKSLNSLTNRKMGILLLLEIEKNKENPSNGSRISFTSNKTPIPSIKTSLSNLFKIQANRYLIKLIDNSRKKYPFVENYIKELLHF